MFYSLLFSSFLFILGYGFDYIAYQNATCLQILLTFKFEYDKVKCKRFAFLCSQLGGVCDEEEYESYGTNDDSYSVL